MLKLAVFDLDGTLAPPGKSVAGSVARRLRELEARGLWIAIASGKDYEYLLSQAEKVGLRNALIIAENGCIVFSRDLALRPLAQLSGVSRLSPDLYQLHDKPVDALLVMKEMDRRYGDSIRLEINLVEVTIFPRDRARIAEIATVASRFASKNLTVVAHDDAVDVIPSEIDKGEALSRIQTVLKIGPEETVSVGNSRNDLPMFGKSGVSYVVGNEIRYKGALRFSTVIQILDDILNRTADQRLPRR